MSLTCVECGTVNADGGIFCTGCGVSLAFATPVGVAAPPVVPAVAAAPRNAFPEEPGRVGGGWIWVLLIALVGAAAVAGTGWWALQRVNLPEGSVPTTRVESALPTEAGGAQAAGEAVEAAQDAVKEAVDAATEAVDRVTPAEPAMVAPPPVDVAPPVVAPPAVKAAPPSRPKVATRRAPVDDGDDPTPPRSAAKPVGPVGGGPASACYGRTGYLLDSCIAAQCRQPWYRNHPGCRGY